MAATRAKNELMLMSYEREPECSFIRQFCEPPTTKATGVRGRKIALATRPMPTVAQRTQWIAKDFIKGTSVVHNAFGHGMIAEKDENTVTIRFADGTVKRFGLSACLTKGLLKLDR